MPSNKKRHVIDLSGNEAEVTKRLKLVGSFKPSMTKCSVPSNSIVKKKEPGPAAAPQRQTGIARKPRDRNPATGEEFVWNVFSMDNFYFYGGETCLADQPWDLGLSVLEDWVTPYNRAEEDYKYNFYNSVQAYALKELQEFWSNDQKKGGTTCIFVKIRRGKSEWIHGPGYACRICTEKKMPCIVLIKHGVIRMLVVLLKED
ncbi:hypothetical protein MMC10_004048 [Thelotrema lepadinum]|nr:hypothetical protein [Thelotrema lepadinum]